MRFRSAIKGKSYPNLPGRASAKDRNNNIERCTQLLKDGIYDVGTFLKQVAFLNVVPITSLETSSGAENLEMTICDITIEDDSTKCVICYSKDRVIAYMPCYHLAQCADCEIQNNCVICGASNVTSITLSTTD